MAVYKKKNSKNYYAQVYVKRLEKAVYFSTGKTNEAEAKEVERAFKNAREQNLPLKKIHVIVDALKQRLMFVKAAMNYVIMSKQVSSFI